MNVGATNSGYGEANLWSATFVSLTEVSIVSVGASICSLLAIWLFDVDIVLLYLLVVVREVMCCVWRENTDQSTSIAVLQVYILLSTGMYTFLCRGFGCDLVLCTHPALFDDVCGG